MRRFFMPEFETLLSDINGCQACKGLPLGPRPVIQASQSAKILIAGQAPGIRVHETGIPFNDPSGDRLRDWMGIDRDVFYNSEQIALIPMGFCYPGTGKSGDLPPRPECAATWRATILGHLSKIELTLIIGQYAINWHLKDQKKRTLTETVKANNKYSENIIVLPHPSPRNNIWLKKNPWFETEIIPDLKTRVRNILLEGKKSS